MTTDSILTIVAFGLVLVILLCGLAFVWRREQRESFTEFAGTAPRQPVVRRCRGCGRRQFRCECYDLGENGGA